MEAEAEHARAKTMLISLTASKFIFSIQKQFHFNNQQMTSNVVILLTYRQPILYKEREK